MLAMFEVVSSLYFEDIPEDKVCPTFCIYQRPDWADWLDWREIPISLSRLCADTGTEIMHILNREMSTQHLSNDCVDAGIEVAPYWSNASFIF